MFLNPWHDETMSIKMYAKSSDSKINWSCYSQRLLYNLLTFRKSVLEGIYSTPVVFQHYSYIAQHSIWQGILNSLFIRRKYILFDSSINIILTTYDNWQYMFKVMYSMSHSLHNIKNHDIILLTGLTILPLRVTL